VEFFARVVICGSILGPGARLDAEPISTPAVDVVVVTARNREERSQDVPISIIALSGRQLSGAPRWLADVQGQYTRRLSERLQSSVGIEYTFHTSPRSWSEARSRPDM
jgi:hypothetical protein